MAHMFKKSRPMSTPSTTGRLPRLPHPGAHRKSCHPKLSWKKVATFGPGPPGLRFGKVGSDMVDFLWASTVGQPQLPHFFWRFRATVYGRKKSGDHQLIIWRIYHYFQGFIHVIWCWISSMNSSGISYKP